MAYLNTTELFDNEQFSDITIQTGEWKIRCHKVILAGHSEYFAKLVDPQGKFVEAKQDTIELKDDVPSADIAVLRFTYKNVFEEDDSDDARFHLEVMKVANKYLMHDARLKASQLLQERVQGLADPIAMYEAHVALREMESELNVKELTDAFEATNFHSLLGVPDYWESLTAECVLERLQWREKMVGVRLYPCVDCGEWEKCYRHCNPNTVFEDGFEKTGVRP